MLIQQRSLTLKKLKNWVSFPVSARTRKSLKASYAFDSKEIKLCGHLTESVIAMAKVIAEKSPVVVWGLKKVLNRNRKSNVKVK